MDSIFNINFPIVDSDKGYFIDLTTNSRDGLIADIKHVLLTTKSTRYYRPSFGANLKKFLFDPNDEITYGQIEAEIQEIMKNYFPKVKVKNLEVINDEIISPLFNEDLKGNKTSSKSPNKENAVKLRITLDIGQGSFDNSQIIQLEL